MIGRLELPDVPRWIEAHGIAADPASWQRALGSGMAVGSDSARLVVVLGDADAAAVTALAQEVPRHTMLFASWITEGVQARFLEEPGCSSAQPYAREYIANVTLMGQTLLVQYRGTYTAIRHDK